MDSTETEDEPKIKTIKAIKNIINCHHEGLKEKCKVRDITVFGSFAHGRQRVNLL